MSEMIFFMAAPLAACVLLAGIHGYLGIHIVSRGVIFADIALAQMAALGAAVGLVFHLEFDSLAANILSVLFTFCGALLLAGVRRFEQKVPAEAFIGVLYVMGAALVVLLMDRAPHGGELVKQLMVGQILWVSWRDVLIEAVVYGLVGVVFLFLHTRLYAVSTGSGGPEKPGSVFFYDMVFYTLFGIVVTVSVRVAGVLLVFTYLVVPAVIAVLLTERFSTRLMTGWFSGIMISLAGISISYWLDFPTGAATVAVAGFFLAVVSVWKGITLNQER